MDEILYLKLSRKIKITITIIVSKIKQKYVFLPREKGKICFIRSEKKKQMKNLKHMDFKQSHYIYIF